MNQINNTDLNLLKSMKALLTEKHVGRAAERMNITQSAMSHTLSRLRDTFDDPLFIRTSKGLEPTKRAVDIAEPLDTVLATIQSLVQPAEIDASSLKATFRIQTHEFITATYLPNVVSKIASQAPHLVFDLKNYTEDSYSQLDRDEVDLVICSGIEAKGHFIQRTLYEEKLVCLMKPAHPAANDWTVESFLKFPHIRISALKQKNDPVYRYTIQNQMPPPNVSMYTETLSMQLPFLKNSEAIAVVPESLADIGVRQYGLLSKPCPFELPTLSIKALWHERNQNDAIHRWLREFFT